MFIGSLLLSYIIGGVVRELDEILHHTSNESIQSQVMF